MILVLSFGKSCSRMLTCMSMSHGRPISYDSTMCHRHNGFQSIPLSSIVSEKAPPFPRYYAYSVWQQIYWFRSSPELACHHSFSACQKLVLRGFCFLPSQNVSVDLFDSFLSIRTRPNGPSTIRLSLPTSNGCCHCPPSMSIRLYWRSRIKTTIAGRLYISSDPQSLRRNWSWRMRCTSISTSLVSGRRWGWHTSLGIYKLPHCP